VSLRQHRSERLAKILGRPAGETLDVAGHNVEHPRREVPLDANDDVDDSRRQTGLR
jgi:hypothetical protein